MTVSQSPSPRQLSWMLVCIGLVTSLSWLDSLQRYADARYHLDVVNTMSEWLHGSDEAEDTANASDATEPATGNVAMAAVRPDLHMPAATSDTASTPSTAAASAAGAAKGKGKTKGKGRAGYSVQPLAAGLFLPSLHNQSFSKEPQRILFAGDSLMQGVAPVAIRDLAKKHPNWQLFDESRQSTGLTVKRYFDWPERIIEDIDKKKLTMVVVFLGPNDPWDIYEPGQHLLFPSPQWVEHYARRVDRILSHAKARGVRVIWIGLPSMRDTRIRDGAIVQNYVFSERARAHGTDYLATENLLGPLSLPFKRSLERGDTPAVDLRSADGVHFTPAGQRRIAQALIAHMDTEKSGP